MAWMKITLSLSLSFFLPVLFEMHPHSDISIYLKHTGKKNIPYILSSLRYACLLIQQKVADGDTSKKNDKQNKMSEE